jgi:hypothetical protein
MNLDVIRRQSTILTDKEAKSHAKEKLSSAQDLDGSLNQGGFGTFLFLP